MSLVTPHIINGIYPLNRDYRANASSVYLSGTDGGATVALCLYNTKGEQVPVLDADDEPTVLTQGTQVTCNHGMDETIYAVVTGATGTTVLNVHGRGIH